MTILTTILNAPYKAAKCILLWMASVVVMLIASVAHTIHLLKAFFLQKQKVHIKQASQLVVITGTDSGMGRATAELLGYQSEFHVLALTLTEKAAKDLNEKFKETKRFTAKKCDVTSVADIANVQEHVTAQLQENENLLLSALINNAAILDPGDFVWNQNLKTAEHTMDVNYFGILRMTHALLPIMVRQNKGGKIINVTSVCGSVGAAGTSAYCGSKFAVEGWSASLRLELKVFGIDVVCVRPGATKTPMFDVAQERIVKNFRAAPKDIQELYGGEKFLDNWSKFVEKCSWALQSTDVVAGLLSDILVCKNPKPHYWAGLDATILYRALYILPTKVSDFLLDCLMDVKPLNVKLD